MLDILYKIDNIIGNIKLKSILIRKIKSIVYYILLKIVNVMMPLIYKLTFNQHYIGKVETEGRKEKIIISLTTFPERINIVWICIESLFRQSIKPDEIVLWLAEDQFSGENSLPKRLLDQQKKGLKIRFCDDLKSHKKYYYSFKDYSKDIIITVDDDVFYPKNTIKNLMDLHKKFPNSICCNRGHVIKINDENTIAPYKEWVKNQKEIYGPSKLLCPTGVGGVLYPSHSVSKEVFNKDSIKKLCLHADDLWLKVMSLINETSVVKAKSFPRILFTISDSQRKALSKINVDEGKNDKQLKNIFSKYSIKIEQFNDNKDTH